MKPTGGKNGRPRNKPEEPQHVAQSLKQASAMWGISASTLKIAKAAGCPAFVQSRIYRDELLKWLALNPEAETQGKALTDAAELKRQKTEAEVALLRAKIKREEKETIPMAEALSETMRFVAICQEEAKALLEPDSYRVFCQRIKTRTGEYQP